MTPPDRHDRGGPESEPRATEWVSFDDPDEDRTWVFDVTFLLTNWSCIYGDGCRGVLTEDAPELEEGCCSYGAYVNEAAEAKRVEKAARKLTKEQWQFRSRGRERGVIKVTKGGNRKTRMADGACIFLNRPGFQGGAGCALHRAAVEAGRPPRDLKPDVCWQMPLHRHDEEDGDGHVTTTIREWRRRHWGDGGADFHWWCTESAEAFVGHEPVYRTLGGDLVAMTSPAVYERLCAYLVEREVGAATVLPHPSLRRQGS